MTNPIEFASSTPRHGLPFLFAGQSQKEVFVNEAHAIADMLLHPAIEGEADDPPASAAEGECWLVGAAPTGDWAANAGALACHQSGAWIFAAPRDGMRVFDRSTGQAMLYAAGWQRPGAPDEPAGGATVDAEARTAIGALVAALVSAGILVNG